jgi:glucose-1-phosphate thymidylyltransferase
MIYVAGKPIIGHILDNLKGLFSDVILIVGYMKDKLIEYVDKNYGDVFNIEYVEQKEILGLGHAIYVAKDAVGESPILITLGDEFFGMSYKDMLDQHKGLLPAGCTLGVKHVENPTHYGVVEEVDGKATQLIEKPKDPTTDLAIAGVYFVEETPKLWEALEEVIAKSTKGKPNNGKTIIQLTDALQLMLERGSELKIFEIPDWYDCGRPEMLLEVNRILLDKYGSENHGVMRRCVLIDPVRIAPDCKLEDSIIGPHVSVAEGTTIKNSIIKNTILGSHTEIENMVLKESIINDEVIMHGREQTVNVGENSEIRMM